jgi:hypothetical protein
LFLLFHLSASTLYGNWNVGSNWVVGPNWEVAESGDVNHDGIVDIYDAMIVSLAYRSTPASSNWNVHADINSDGRVSLADAVLLVIHYGDHI